MAGTSIMTVGNICLGLLCGLPASGKSTLAFQIQNYATDTSDQQTHVLLVSYDKLIPADLEKQLIAHVSEQGGSLWKSTRNQIIKCVDCLLNHLVSAPGSLSQCVTLFVDDSHSKSLKYPAADGSCSDVQGLSKPPDVDCVLWERFLHLTGIGATRTAGNSHSGGADSCSWLILIDDNMHYSSMRYEYCQLARKYEVGLCIIHMACPVEEALARNRLRMERVQDHVISLMDRHLEVPDANKRHWEKYSATVDATANVELHPLMQLVNEAMMDPQKSLLEEDTEVKVIHRYICSTNVIHQADQILRRCVSQRMIEAKGGGLNSVELKTISGDLTKLRTDILSGMRKAEIMLPFQLDESSICNASKDVNTPLFQFVQNLFLAKTSVLH